MAPKTGTVGGGSATGLAKDFTGWLDSILNPPAAKTNLAAPAGQFNSADPVGQTAGIGGVINDILSGGAGKLGGSLNELIKQQQKTDVGDLRARFGAAGGMAFGTPAATAEALYRAQAAPQAATQIGNLQLSAITPLLNIIAGLSGKGIPQAETAIYPNPWLSGLEALGGAASGAGSLAKGLA